MKTAFFRFYEALNDFLPQKRRNREFSCDFDGRPTVKHLIESIGVPHTEIDVILVNGVSVDFKHYVANSDRIAVYSVFNSLDIKPIFRLGPTPPRPAAFILDVHLGKLARMLRLLGFDALYRNDYEDSRIVQIAAAEHRIVLTRDVQLLKAKMVTHGYWIRAMNPEAQVVEVLRRFDLFNQFGAVPRCLACNGVIHETSKEAVWHLLEPKTKIYYREFFQCADCGRVYWKGTHFPRLKEKIDRWRALPSTCIING
ncbi:MAG: Mut7-C RNAse domain-containing protein [Desulfobacterales bacterium]|nr:Mut7-C RNAse domain-containing protein [Desulfobacterales bacterium]